MTFSHCQNNMEYNAVRVVAGGSGGGMVVVVVVGLCRWPPPAIG